MKRVSRMIGKEPKKISLELSDKNLIKRAIIAGVCLFLAVIFFLNSCTKYLNKSTYLTIDYPVVETSTGAKKTIFNNNVDLKYYYDKDVEQVGTSKVFEKINNILEDKMTYLYKLCDHEDLYLANDAPIHNIKYINDNKNTWVSIDPILYSLLKDAIEVSELTENKYSLFASKLYEAWDEIFLYVDVNGYEEVDPEYNEYKKSNINSIVSSINNDNTYLEFNDEEKSVKFNVSELDEENVDINLGLVEYAFYLDELKKELKNVNLNSGYIQNTAGMVATLGINHAGSAYIFESKSFQTLYNNNSTILDYSFMFNGDLNYMTFNPMINPKFDSSNDNYYFIKNRNIYYRSMIINATNGDSFSKNYSTFTFGTDKTFVKQLIDNYNLYFNEYEFNINYLLQFEEDTKYGAIVSFNAEENNISFKGETTLLYSKLVEGYFKENYIPYIKLSTVVKNKIVAKEGE